MGASAADTPVPVRPGDRVEFGSAAFVLTDDA